MYSLFSSTLMSTSGCCRVSPLKLNFKIQDFWKGGSDPSRGGSISTFYLIFHKFPHEIEIIWFQSFKGGSSEQPEPPLN